MAAIRETGATRIVIDSLSEFLLYLAPEFRREFRLTVFRILSSLAKLGVTVLVTMGAEDRFTELRFSDSEIAFLTDGIIATRYVEMAGELTKVISVVKLRGCSHSNALRAFRITDDGIEVDDIPGDGAGIHDLAEAAGSALRAVWGPAAGGHH